MGNSIEEDIKILEELRIANENCIKNAKIKDNPFAAIWEKQNRAIEHILRDYKRVLKEVKRYKNMYEAEYQIHLVRNEQLDRKQKAIIKCNELENVNKELKEEIKSWKKYSDEQEENIILKNNIICNLEFQIEKQQKEIKDKIEELNRKIDKSIDNSKGGLDEEFVEKAGELLAQKRILQELLGSEE